MAATFLGSRRSVLPGKGGLYEILGDGRRVWVNGPDGSSVARFHATIDIHRPVSEQSDKGQCLFCTQTFVTEPDWFLFVEKVEYLFGLIVPDEFKPVRFVRLSGPQQKSLPNKHEGSTLESFFEELGELEEVRAQAASQSSPMKICNFCKCPGENHKKDYFAQTVDGRLICSTCWHYDVCTSWTNRNPDGPCSEPECPHRPRLDETGWTDQEGRPPSPRPVP